MATTVAAYDAMADAYVERHADTPSDLIEFRARFAAGVRPGGRVVDLGCGPGTDARALGAAGLAVLGVDLSGRMLGWAARRGVTVVRGDLRQPPVRARSLDGVWAVASLLHVPSEDLGSTLLAWRRLLRRDGVLGFTTALGDGEGWERPGRASQRQWFVHHRRERLLAAVGAAGFAVGFVAESTSHRRWLQVLATV